MNTLIALIPALIDGIKTGMNILERINNKDMTVEQEALDWLAVGKSVEEAVKNWEASKKPA